MKGYWTNFAPRGIPTSFGTPFWPLFIGFNQAIVIAVVTRSRFRAR